MNLWFRMLRLMLFARLRPRIDMLDTCETRFRTWLFDLDLLRHMNNGRYFTLQDLARVDLMLRSGVMHVLDKNGWYPVVTSESLQFRKALKLFEPFTLRTRVLGWTEREFVLEHTFVRGETAIAYGLVNARFLKKTGGLVSVRELVEAAGLKESPELPAYAIEWIAQQEKIGATYKRSN